MQQGLNAPYPDLLLLQRVALRLSYLRPLRVPTNQAQSSKPHSKKNYCNYRADSAQHSCDSLLLRPVLGYSDSGRFAHNSTDCAPAQFFALPQANHSYSPKPPLQRHLTAYRQNPPTTLQKSPFPLQIPMPLWNRGDWFGVVCIWARENNRPRQVPKLK